MLIIQTCEIFKYVVIGYTDTQTVFEPLAVIKTVCINGGVKKNWFSPYMNCIFTLIWIIFMGASYIIISYIICFHLATKLFNAFIVKFDEPD